MNQNTLDSLALRSDFRAIARWVEPRSTVLDLGCGDGSLLSLLNEELDVQGYGIEINDAGVLAATQNGVNVIQQNLEDGLRLFEDGSFDFAVLVGVTAAAVLAKEAQWQALYQGVVKSNGVLE